MEMMKSFISLKTLEVWFPDPQRCLVGFLIAQGDCEMLKP